MTTSIRFSFVVFADDRKEINDLSSPLDRYLKTTSLFALNYV